MNTITRSQFIEAIEQGISAAAQWFPLPQEVQDNLREVARTSTRVARGLFEVLDPDSEGGVCFCPVKQAGYDPHVEGSWLLSLTDVAYTFDDYTRERGIEPYNRILTVVD